MREYLQGFIENPLAQIVGVFALIAVIVSFQQNDQKRIVFWQTIGSFMFAAHFLMLGAITGSVLNLFSALRNIVFYHRGKPWADSIWWPIGFGAIFVVACFCTWEGAQSLLPLFGCLIFTVSLRIQNAKTVRSLCWMSCVAWIIYNAINQSAAGIVTEGLCLIGFIVAFFRFDFKKKKEN